MPKFLTNRSMVLAVSTTASWAWGTSLIMGMQIMNTKGILPFLIWGIFNCLTLFTFGLIATKTDWIEKARTKFYSKWFALVIQMFSLIIQVNITFVVLTRIGVEANIAMWVAAFITIAFILSVIKTGIKMSIFTDQFQWWIMIVSVALILGIGIFTGQPFMAPVIGTTPDILWAVWSAVILMSGPIGDMQHWQRGAIVKAEKLKTAYPTAMWLFAMYLTFVGILGLFQFNAVMNYILLIATLMVTTSTVDSIAATFHEMGNKYIGTAIGIALALGWNVFVQMGVLELWSKFGIIRVIFACLIVVGGIWGHKFAVALEARKG